MPEVLLEEPQVNLTSYPDRFLTCRALQHMWVPMGLPQVERAPDDAAALVVYEKFMCQRCSATKTDQRTPYGRFIRRSYHHEAGYRVSGEGHKKEGYAGERYKRILGDALTLELESA